MRFSIGRPAKRCLEGSSIGQSIEAAWAGKYNDWKSTNFDVPNLDMIFQSEQSKVDWYRWINQGGSWKTYRSLGRVEVSHIALSQCVVPSWAHSHCQTFPPSIFPFTTFFFSYFSRIMPWNILLHFNWNLSGSRSCILNWRLPSQIWSVVFVTKNKGLTSEFCLIGDICAAE